MPEKKDMEDINEEQKVGEISLDQTSSAHASPPPEEQGDQELSTYLSDGASTADAAD